MLGYYLKRLIKSSIFPTKNISQFINRNSKLLLTFASSKDKNKLFSLTSLSRLSAVKVDQQTRSTNKKANIMDLKESGDRMPQQIALKSTQSGNYVVIFVRNIIYIEKYKASNHSFVYYQDAYDGRMNVVSVKNTVNELSYILPNPFIKANRSLIINMRYVTGYSADCVFVWTPDIVKTFCMKNWAFLAAQIVEL